MFRLPRVFLLAVALSAASVAPAASADASGQTPQSRMQAVIDGLGPAVEIEGRPVARSGLVETMQALHVPGVAIAVIRQGKVDWAKGFGLTREGGEPVTARTLFQAGSVSKPIAAMTALRLVQEGRLSLDGDADAILKTWKIPSNPYTGRTPVTLRALLSHTAGTTVHGFAGYAAGEAVPTLPQVLGGVAPANSKPVVVDRPVGHEYAYSGGGYSIAQQLMVDATGAPFAELVRKTVLAPLGMSRSTEQQPLQASRLAHAAWPHDGAGAPIPGGPHTYPEMAAAGLWTTAEDLARFAIELQRAASGRQGRVLTADMGRLMTTRVKGDYGLGVSILGSAKAPYFYHDGSNAGYKATLLGYPASGDGVVVLTNGDQGYELGQKIARAVAVVYGWPDLHPVKRAAVDLAADQLARYAGSFEIEGVGGFEIHRRDGGLALELWKGVVEPMYAQAPGRFFITSHDLVLTFDGPDRGRIAAPDFKGSFARAKP